MVAAPRTSLQAVGEEESSKRRQILDGARKVFLELGFDGASMGEIARAAAVSKGTLYVYFPDKAGLFAAIVEEEKLSVTERDLDTFIYREAARTNEKPDKFAKELARNREQLRAAQQSILFDKAVDFLVSKAKVTPSAPQPA